MGGGGGHPLRVLVVAASPDERLSTRTLIKMVAALRRRPDVEVAVWFLREHSVPPWTEARVVDELRTRPYTWPLSLVGLDRVAGGIRGAILRRWFAEVDPDVVLLDDGLGARLLPSAPRSPVVAIRPNPEPPSFAYLEGEGLAAADLVLAPEPPEDPAAGTWVPTAGRLFDTGAVAAIERGAADARRSAREALGLAPDELLVAGWGAHSWVDGSDLFVRALWFLEHRHGRSVHGVWLGPTDDHVEVADLRAEAARCGLADRFHLLPDCSEPARWCGDATFLPYRVPAAPLDLRRAAVADQTVVTFEPATEAGPWIVEVPFLDLEAAAAALDAALEPRAGSWAEGVAADAWAARFVDAVRARR